MKAPMLLSNDEVDLNDLDYSNMFISVKRDGVRAEIINGELLGRSLKKFRNYKLHDFFKNITDFCKFYNITLEGEIYSNTIPCRELAGICNSLDYDLPSDLKLYIFGLYNKELTFCERYELLNHLSICKEENIVIVMQERAHNKEFVEMFFTSSLSEGYEGAVLMDGSKKYKEGRVTIKEHIGFKLKPEQEDDLEIIGVNERFINTNESEINELGYKFKRNTVDAKQSTGIAATFDCKLPNGEITKVTITGDEEYRKEIWNNKNDYIGQFAVVKSMSYGTKDKLRHPRLVGVKLSMEK
jgi:hypothetical protein